MAAQVKLSPPVEVAQIDLGKLGGTLVSQLAWSPDGNELYLQTQTEDKKGLPKDTYHYVMSGRGRLVQESRRAARLGGRVLDVEVGTDGARRCGVQDQRLHGEARRVGHGHSDGR